MNILIYGKSGLARTAAQIARLLPGIEPVGFIADEAVTDGETLMDLPVLPEKDRGTIEHDAIIIALLQPEQRKRFHDRLIAAGEIMTTLIHPSAIIAPDAVIQDGCLICAGAVIGSECRIRGNSLIGPGSIVDFDAGIGPHAHVGQGASIAQSVTVAEGATLKSGASVKESISIGSWATVGVGSAATADVEPGTTVVGVPARSI